MMDTYFFPDDPLGRIRDDIARVAGYLWERGWAERNAGNMSVNITGLEKIDLERIKNNTVHKLGNTYPNLAGKVILLTGTGTRMRDIAIDPEPYICKIRLLESGNAFQQICEQGEEGKVWPTSELPTHLLIHDMLVERKAPEKAILHTHVNELIALTQIREFTNTETLNNLLWSMHPETVFFIPEGAGLVPYALPGTNRMAIETRKVLENHNVVIWEKHGALAVSPSLPEAFDLIDILAKAARIFFMVRGAGYEPERMKPENLDEIRKTYLEDKG